jgi:hypothetical protein
VLLRPLPARNEVYGYGVPIAYLEASGERVDTKFELWRELIYDIRGLRLDSYGIAEAAFLAPGLTLAGTAYSTENLVVTCGHEGRRGSRCGSGSSAGVRARSQGMR